MIIEQLILTNLIKNSGYIKKVLPFLKGEYFLDNKYKILFEQVRNFHDIYGGSPPVQAIRILIDDEKRLTEYEAQGVNEILDLIDKEDIQQYDLQWLVDESEKFCQDKALFNAITQSINIMDGKEGGLSKGSIPLLLNNALSVCFDNNVGHDYFDDYSNRFDFYHTVEERIPFDLKYFNKITRGGLPKKTLSIVLAGTNVGKSLFMCHISAAALLNNRNVLYITLEMSEERISERIDANLLNIPIDQLESIPKEIYEKKINKLKESCKGKLIVKEYPTATANAGHFRALLNDLKIKKNFIPDLICIDYLNICSSLRLKIGSNINSYTYIKAIAEELRGLAVEFNVPILSATQTTRSGFCLDLNTKVIEKNKGIICLKNAVVGDKLQSINGFNEIKTIFPITRKKMYKITTSSGKYVICSEDHKFPTSSGMEKSISSGLIIGDNLIVKI